MTVFDHVMCFVSDEFQTPVQNVGLFPEATRCVVVDFESIDFLFPKLGFIFWGTRQVRLKGFRCDPLFQ